MRPGTVGVGIKFLVILFEIFALQNEYSVCDIKYHYKFLKCECAQLIKCVGGSPL